MLEIIFSDGKQNMETLRHHRGKEDSIIKAINVDPSVRIVAINEFSLFLFESFSIIFPSKFGYFHGIHGLKVEKNSKLFLNPFP